MPTEPLLSLENVTFKDSQGFKTILEDISFSVHESDILTIIGPNGAGKTTLLKLILGLNQPSEGKIWRKPDTLIGYMPQKIEINSFLPLTVSRLLQLSQKKHIAESEIIKVLEMIQITALKNQSLQTLSGGEWQKVLLARALLRQPKLLVLDEPAQGVDVIGQAEFYQLLITLRNQLNCAIVLVSHDLHLVMAATDHVICLNRHICCSGHPDTVIKDPQYRVLFGEKKKAPTDLGLASYTHHHNHRHDCSDDHHDE
jgi:zinc transport system ATP-binding protein